MTSPYVTCIESTIAPANRHSFFKESTSRFLTLAELVIYPFPLPALPLSHCGIHVRVEPAVPLSAINHLTSNGPIFNRAKVPKQANSYAHLCDMPVSCILRRTITGCCLTRWNKYGTGYLKNPCHVVGRRPQAKCQPHHDLPRVAQRPADLQVPSPTGATDSTGYGLPAGPNAQRAGALSAWRHGATHHRRDCLD